MSAASDAHRRAQEHYWWIQRFGDLLRLSTAILVVVLLAGLVFLAVQVNDLHTQSDDLTHQVDRSQQVLRDLRTLQANQQTILSQQTDAGDQRLCVANAQSNAISAAILYATAEPGSLGQVYARLLLQRAQQDLEHLATLCPAPRLAEPNPPTTTKPVTPPPTTGGTSANPPRMARSRPPGHH